MRLSRFPRTILRQQQVVAAVVIVAVSHLVTLLVVSTWDEYPFAPLEVAAAAVMAVAYLALFAWDESYFRRFPTPAGTAAFFFIQITLCLGMQLNLAIGTLGLVSMPLVAAAEARLRQRWRWLIYLVALVGPALSIGLWARWTFALVAGVLYSPGIILVVVFVRLLQNERQARQQAETLSQQLETANRQLSLYADQVEELATMQERNRLAREIHDTLGHYLTVVNVQIEAARAVLKTDQETVVKALEVAQSLAQEGLLAVRQSVMALREAPLGDKTLPEAIAALVGEAQLADLPARFHVKGTPRSLPSKAALTLFRVAQEGLTNARKHAQASRVEVTLDYEEPGWVRLSVTDNGVGMDVAQTNGGYGLLGVRERVQLLGGRVELSGAGGQGTRLAVEIPG
ncbi:MAG: sensor histidine kinase [Chloroflexota bacterium]